MEEDEEVLEDQIRIKQSLGEVNEKKESEKKEMKKKRMKKREAKKQKMKKKEMKKKERKKNDKFLCKRKGSEESF